MQNDPRNIFEHETVELRPPFSKKPGPPNLAEEPPTYEAPKLTRRFAVSVTVILLLLCFNATLESLFRVPVNSAPLVFLQEIIYYLPMGLVLLQLRRNPLPLKRRLLALFAIIVLAITAFPIGGGVARLLVEAEDVREFIGRATLAFILACSGFFMGIVYSFLIDLLLSFWRRLQTRASTSTDPAARKRFRVLLAGSSPIALSLLVAASLTQRSRQGTAIPGLEPRADNPETLDLLFVGNSLTSFNRLPDVISALAVAGQVENPISYSAITPGGYTIGDHLTDGVALAAINQGGWDYVVFQHASWDVVYDTGQMYADGRVLSDAIKAKKATPLVYMTWNPTVDVYEIPPINTRLLTVFSKFGKKLKNGGNPPIYSMLTQDNIQEDAGVSIEAWIEAYRGLAETVQAPYVPAALAWRKLREKRPELSLYHESGSHPSNIGTYLTACTFYATLYKQSPVGLPSRLTLDNGPGTFEVLVDVPEPDAADIQQAAWDAAMQAPTELLGPLEPSTAQGYFAMGMVHLGQQKNDLARSAFQKFSELDPEHRELADRAIAFLH